jgi:uncharacterized ubiquitin-like protein YukD
MKVYVETNRGKLEYTVAEDIKVLILKGIISMNTNVDIKEFWLTFKVLDILEDDKKLSEYNINEGDCLMAEGKLSPSYTPNINLTATGRRVHIQSLLSRLKALN